ncbi:hypothetical protein diail_3303 [Diaporthe ilicicola]|nr:hypothetical protein diail_3303 [Diaporthe ilicicola]
MELGARCLRVAMLNADTSVPNVYANLGTFGDILHRKLLAAADRRYHRLNIVHSVFNVVMGEYPDSLDDLDAVFITASAASSYDDEAWIKRLQEYVVMVYTMYPKVKLFGSCFGHHIICQALLKDYGVRVARRPGGWEVGVSEVRFTNEFRGAFGHVGPSAVEECCLRLRNRLPSPESESESDEEASCALDRVGGVVPYSAYLEFVHADEVVLPEFSLPKPWVLLGSTGHCKVPGIYQAGRVLTLQGHFEFDTFKSQETMRIFGADEASNPEPSSGSGAVKTSGPEYNDGEVVVDILVRFLAEEWAVTNRLRCDDIMAHADLPTP